MGMYKHKTQTEQKRSVKREDYKDKAFDDARQQAGEQSGGQFWETVKHYTAVAGVGAGLAISVASGAQANDTKPAQALNQQYPSNTVQAEKQIDETIDWMAPDEEMEFSFNYEGTEGTLEAEVQSGEFQSHDAYTINASIDVDSWWEVAFDLDMELTNYVDKESGEVLGYKFDDQEEATSFDEQNIEERDDVSIKEVVRSSLAAVFRVRHLDLEQAVQDSEPVEVPLTVAGQQYTVPFQVDGPENNNKNTYQLALDPKSDNIERELAGYLQENNIQLGMSVQNTETQAPMAVAAQVNGKSIDLSLNEHNNKSIADQPSGETI